MRINLNSIQNRHKLFELMRIGPAWSGRYAASQEDEATWSEAIIQTETYFSVTSAGLAHSPLMVISDCDGQHNNAVNGLPSQALQLLKRMLSAIECALDKNVYWLQVHQSINESDHITRTFDQDHCRANIQEQVKNNHPKVVLLLGETVVNLLLGQNKSLDALSGRVLSFPFTNQALPVIASLHPNQLLSMPIKKRQAWQDLLLVKRYLI